MQAVISVAYYLAVLYFAILLFFGFLRAKDFQRSVLYLVVLMPFVLRILRLK
ncbi:MAG: hypothetical protein ACM3RP_09040 [Chitinophagales bacterium]